MTEIESLIATAKQAPAIAASVAQVRSMRYVESPEGFEALLWLLVAQAIATGRSIGMRHASSIIADAFKTKPVEAPKT